MQWQKARPVPPTYAIISETKAKFDDAFSKMNAEEKKQVQERLKAQLDRDQAWSRHFDIKLGTILATAGILIGLGGKILLEEGVFLKEHVVIHIGLLLALTLFVASSIYALLGLSPKLSWKDMAFWKWARRPLTQDNPYLTQIYFDHITTYQDLQPFVTDVLLCYSNEAIFAAQMTQQVHANAWVAQDKALQTRWSIKLLFLGILLAGVVFIATLLYFVFK